MRVKTSRLDHALCRGAQTTPSTIVFISDRSRTKNIGSRTHSVLVRFLVEVIEQEVEHDGVQQNDPRERLGVVAFDEQQLRRVDEHHDELDLRKGTGR